MATLIVPLDWQNCSSVGMLSYDGTSIIDAPGAPDPFIGTTTSGAGIYDNTRHTTTTSGAGTYDILLRFLVAAQLNADTGLTLADITITAVSLRLSCTGVAIDTDAVYDFWVDTGNQMNFANFFDGSCGRINGEGRCFAATLASGQTGYINGAGNYDYALQPSDISAATALRLEISNANAQGGTEEFDIGNDTNSYLTITYTPAGSGAVPLRALLGVGL